MAINPITILKAILPAIRIAANLGGAIAVLKTVVSKLTKGNAMTIAGETTELNKKFDFEFESGVLTVTLDLNQDGTPFMETKINVLEIPDEIMDMIKGRKEQQAEEEKSKEPEASEDK